MKKVEFKKIKNSLNKIFRLSAEHFFLSFLILVFVALLLGGILFYKYNILVEEKELEIGEQPIQFKESLYQKVLAEWQKKEEKFEGTETKKYPDPFR